MLKYMPPPSLSLAMEPPGLIFVVIAPSAKPIGAFMRCSASSPP